MSRAVIGWDIGGVNTKAAYVRDGSILDVRSHPFEIQRAPRALPSLLQRIARELGAEPGCAHAVTMTAELSQLFRTKREGVSAIVDAVEHAFPGEPLSVYAVDGRFLPPREARASPLRVAAANWSATATMVAAHWSDAILIDVGTTTTDIIPIAGGRVVAEGWTDPDRLRTGELVYVGAVRTPVEALVHEVPLGDAMAGVSAESFALAGDVHLWRGDLAPADYTAPTPDGRPATREHAHERLARVVCADREMLDERAIDAIADYVARAEVDRIARALARVHGQHPSIPLVIAAGLGAFLALAAAHQARLPTIRLADELGGAAARSAPAAAVALLLDRTLPR